MKRIYPRIKFSGNQFADTLSAIFAENLEDLLEKVETKENPPFPKGFMHTSTVQHEGTCYYRNSWSRDAGRGVQELARFGFMDEAMACSEYFLAQLKGREKWGRIVNGSGDGCETDGNTHILNSLYQIWKSSGCNKETGTKFITETKPVFKWFKDLMKECPYGYLAVCHSELAGNPAGLSPDVYAIYPNYGIWVVLNAYEKMARKCGLISEADYFNEEAVKLKQAITEKLVSKEGVFTLIPHGVWLNGIDGRNGSSYEFAHYGRNRFYIHKWTRQIPFIQDFDYDNPDIAGGISDEVNQTSYDYILREMAKGYFFRKYGFVSNTCWEGAGGRHDDTMCGYGQNYMTQAALMADDVNAYSKCIEGIARLGYDGDIIEPLSFEMNPWIMHECFNYDNYEAGLDHTFGRYGDDSRDIMNNPGDEGNLVQAAETLKSVALMAGLEFDQDNKTLVFKPRIPWDFNEMKLIDYPLFDSEGINRTELTYRQERWLRKTFLNIKTERPIDICKLRFGPYAHHFPEKASYLVYPRRDNSGYVITKPEIAENQKENLDLAAGTQCGLLQTKNATWIAVKDLKMNGNSLVIEVIL